ncbi:MAG: geranylgeranylglycerol-phosphate geranylgeranyltransferase [Crocinitomicaceae bacterium]
MKNLLHFFRLVRFGNLMVIGATMLVIQIFIVCHENGNSISQILTSTESFSQKYLTSFQLNFNFLLLILSVMLIAGAGNIINDYFDVKADRVNKPERLIIGKHIKRRWAIMFNWIFNIIGLGFAIYLSYINSNWWIAGIAFVTINFLWFYSAVYKRKLFVGNLLVALMVGIVPIYVMIYNLPIYGFQMDVGKAYVEMGPFFIYEVVIIISVIAFVINLMRELIKDMADIRGDVHLAAKTVPIALGIRRTKTILFVILIPLLLLMAYYIFDIYYYANILNAVPVKKISAGMDTAHLNNITAFNSIVILSGVSCIISFIILLTANNRKSYIRSAKVLKLAMLFGMLSPLFLCYA